MVKSSGPLPRSLFVTVTVTSGLGELCSLRQCATLTESSVSTEPMPSDRGEGPGRREASPHRPCKLHKGRDTGQNSPNPWVRPPAHRGQFPIQYSSPALRGHAHTHRHAYAHVHTRTHTHAIVHLFLSFRSPELTKEFGLKKSKLPPDIAALNAQEMKSSSFQE